MSGSVGGVDTSIYSTIKGPDLAAPTQQVNPLAMAQGFQNLQRTGLENNQMYMQQQAKLAIGRAAQAAIDPKTGQVDEDRFIQNVGADPMSAPYMQDMMNAQAARRLQQSQTSTMDLTRGLTTAENMTAGLSTLINDPNPIVDNSNSQSYRNKIFDTVRSYIAMAGHGDGLPIAMNFLKQLPAPGPDGNDTPESIQAMRQLLINKQLAFKNTAETLKMVLPDYEASRTNTGDLIWNKNQAMTAPGMAPLTGAFINKGATPELLAGTQPGPPDAYGNNRVVPTATVLPSRGVLPAGTITYPNNGALGGMAGVQGGQSGAQSTAAPPARTGTGWGQSPSNVPATTPQGQGNAPPPPNAAPPGKGAAGADAFDPVIPPGRNVQADPVTAMTSGQPYQTELSEGQKALLKEKAEGWQAGKASVTAAMQGDQAATQAILAEEKATKDFAAGPGTETALALALRLKAIANLAPGIPGMASIGNTADNIIKNPDNPQAVAQAQSAAQAFASFNFTTISGMFDKLRGTGPGNEAELEGIKQSYIDASTTKGAKESIYDFAKTLAAYDLAKSKGAQIYENKANDVNAIPDYNDFSTQWASHALKHGFGSVTPQGVGVIKVPGDTEGLLTSVGLHPKAQEMQTQAMPPHIISGIQKSTGKRIQVQVMPDGSYVPLGAQ